MITHRNIYVLIFQFLKNHITKYTVDEIWTNDT